VKSFLRKLFSDQSGEIDEKRVLGVPVFVLGILFALVVGIVAIATSKTDIVGPGLAVAGFLTGAGLTVLGLAVAGDQGKLGSGA
jgi:hypothetical protein